MEDLFQKKSREAYAKHAQSSANPTVVAGRREKDAEKEPFIWSSIFSLLDLSHLEGGNTVLDIGCGSGYIAQKWIDLVEINDARVFLNDIPEMVQRAKKDLEIKKSQLVEFVPGLFPSEISPELLKNETFDYIVMYSVAHYTSHPIPMIEAAIDLLRPGGRMLVGDLPNVNKKGRFLASQAGRKFDAEYKGIEISDAPVYSDHHEFVRQCSKESALISDSFVEHFMKKYRDLGFDVYVVPQSSDLPFCKTREDLLICRHD